MHFPNRREELYYTYIILRSIYFMRLWGGSRFGRDWNTFIYPGFTFFISPLFLGIRE